MAKSDAVGNKKRKIAVVVASRANYGRVKSLLKAIQDHPKLELQLIVGASVLLYRFGKAVDIIEKDGFRPCRSIHYIVEGETPVTQAKSTGLGIVELSSAFADLKPDIVVTVADRFETMATAIAASYLNIPLAHLQGGEVSGNIDEKVRHAITKLADIHFPATEKSKERVIRMGEDPGYVFNFGCPAMDLITKEALKIDNSIMSSYLGVGAPFDWTKPYILMLLHPVTTSYGEGRKQVEAVLDALLEMKGFQKVILWPNADAGSDDVSKGLRVFREKHPTENFHFFRNFSPEDFIRVLNNASVAVGNSSSFIREGSMLGTPVVLVGDRQEGREHGRNIVFAAYDPADILKKLQGQAKHGRYPGDKIFGSGNAGKRIADKLATIELNREKRLTY